MLMLKELLNILVCPQCKGELNLVKDVSGMLCPGCRLKYPIRDDVPIMLIEEAEKVNEG